MIVKELEPLVGKVEENKLNKLNLFLINCCLDSSQRQKLVKILSDEATASK